MTGDVIVLSLAIYRHCVALMRGVTTGYFLSLHHPSPGIIVHHLSVFIYGQPRRHLSPGYLLIWDAFCLDATLDSNLASMSLDPAIELSWIHIPLMAIGEQQMQFLPFYE